MKKILIILTLFLIFLNIGVFAASNTVKKEYKVQSVDGFSIKATLEYPKIKGVKVNEYKTVILLHSLGYSSEWWETLPQDLINNGYAVLKIDLRGHGGSVYNAKLLKMSWKSLTKNAFAKYPDDVISVVNYINTEQSKIKFFNDWAVVGADVGGSTAILASWKMDTKPKTIVLMSPTVNTRGLYIPVKLAELGNIDILSISGTNDVAAHNAQDYLKKFAQAEFVTYTSDSKSTGMLMLKNDSGLSKFIAAWIRQYLK